MKYQIYLISTLLIALPCLAFAQTDIDAFRFSRASTAGTARSISMGGAFGALGGDFSTLASNPAGIAIFRGGEFTFSPSIYSGSTDASFLGNKIDENKFNFNFGNIGVVTTQSLSRDDASPGWKSWNFGFGYNRLNNFHNRFSYEGFNTENSITQSWAQRAQGLNFDDLDQFNEQLAYYTYLINPDASNNYSAEVSDGNVLQIRSAESRGSMGEVNFSMGANYSNRLYIGGSLGFASIRYIDEVTYEEVDRDQLVDSLSFFSFNQNLTTKGLGFNFKFGMIYRANDWLRFGAAIHTPTWYDMNDKYNSDMSAKFDSGFAATKQSPLGEFDYEFTSPFKAIGSIAFIFGKHGLLSAEYEFSDISQARISAPGFSFNSVNDAIRKKYQEHSTVRLGAEWRYGNYSVRGGAAFTSSPVNSRFKAGGSDFSAKNFGGGFGIRDNNIFVDFGYFYGTSDEYYQPYTLSSENVPGVINKVSSNNFTMTFGVKF
ncbi:MAG: hypothetical protein DWQ44_09120 [Bacteroidetes bacterium]|nr:MAG: hypothetical protein DWQ33_02655 [Bacteroidota bacterium]REK06449.1 MAG: hypothetical protein DWQ39_02910 [Bacteroidota bacterium]REK33215.1 MAG: hypothetical protein DWQ44_09120 [Bacteroidota bacterium]REK47052.1 MAG: hypothetical protein DWQ48_13455 [Bacteroidota bacterium]